MKRKYGNTDPLLNNRTSKCIVIKVGGSILHDANNVASLCNEINVIQNAGQLIVLVHGGSKAINRSLALHGIHSEFSEGLRITSAVTAKIIEMVLCGEVNTMIVRELNRIGLPALGLSGAANQLLLCDPHSAHHGFVGEIKKINSQLIEHSLTFKKNNKSAIPVIAPIGISKEGQVMNVNADFAACHIAIALGAAQLIFLTDQDGIYNKQGQYFAQLDKTILLSLIAQKEVNGGMLVKVKAILCGLKAGLNQIRILNGNHKQILIDSLLNKERHGTLCCTTIHNHALNTTNQRKINNVDHMAKKTETGYLDATAILENVVKEGVPFRDAHHQVGLRVKEALEKGCSLTEIISSAPPISPPPISSPPPIISAPQIGSPSVNASRVQHLLTGMELNQDTLSQLLQLTSQIKRNPNDYSKQLENKTLALLFEKPSFRTRLSFTLAITTLGGIAVESCFTTQKQEEPRDLIRVLNGYCNFVMLRTHEDSKLEAMAKYAQIPIINGLSSLYHPCQILADLFSLQRHFGTLNGLTLAYIGDGNNILHSLLTMAPKLGVKIHYSCPPQQQPKATILNQSKQAFPSLIKSYPSPSLAVENADAVYTDVWTSMGFEKQNDAIFLGFQVNEALLSQAKPNAVFMHCMPMERGKEVSTTLPDSPCSIIFSQSENRLHVQKALLLYLENNL